MEEQTAAIMPPQQQQGPIATMQIAVMANGQVKVGGPINDKILCLGALELAKKAILDFDPAKQGKIVLPEPVLNGQRL